MKLTNLIIGFIVFSLVVSLMFGAAYDILHAEGTDGADDFKALSGEYYTLTKEMADEESVTRDITEQEQVGAGVKTDEPEITAYKGALSGGKMAINFFANFENIIHNASGDASSGGENYIDSKITNGIKFVIIVILAFALLHFIWRFKMET